MGTTCPWTFLEPELLSGHHDEMLFITIHQISELWMKQIPRVAGRPGTHQER